MKELKLWEVWQVYMFVLTHYLGLEVRGLEVRGLEPRGKRLMDVILNGRKKELKNENQRKS